MAGFDLTKIRKTLESIPEQFANKEAKVGWFPAAQYENGTPVAYVALIQEKGAPEAGIPARPFIGPTVDKHQSEWVELLGAGAASVMRGKHTADDVLTMVGAQVVGDIQEQIASNSVQALSPVTLVLRKWRREGRVITGKTVGEAAAAYANDPSIIGGVNADPLQDSGLLIDSINHTVGPKE